MHPKKMKYRKKWGVGNCGGAEKAPWELKGWTREEWLRWHRKWQPDTLSDSATLNPS